MEESNIKEQSLVVDTSNNKRKIRQITLIAILVASAAALQMLESPLPRLFPWLKIGLANVITLFAIIRINGITGICIAALRTCLAAIVFGSFLSPIHIISFSGAVSAALIMALINRFISNSSLCIISVFGAITSNIAQLIAVQLLFASNLTFWLHLALIILVGIPTGLVVGKITYELLKRTEQIA